MLNWMPSALAAREKGLPVVNIAQPFKSSGLMLTCWKDTGHRDARRISRARRMGVWFFGNEYPVPELDEPGWASRPMAARTA